MKSNIASLLSEFKQTEKALEKEIRNILMEKSPEDLRNAFFDGVETTPFKRKKENFMDVCSLVKGFTSGFMMYLKDEKEGRHFMKFKEEFIVFFKEHLDITVKTYNYEVYDNPGGESHRLLVSKK